MTSEQHSDFAAQAIATFRQIGDMQEQAQRAVAALAKTLNDIAATADFSGIAATIAQQAAALTYTPNRHERRAAKHARKRGKK